VVFVKQPPGFIIEGKEHKVLRLHKALYGLWKGCGAWNIKLNTTISSLSFTKCATEHALYT